MTRRRGLKPRGAPSAKYRAWLGDELRSALQRAYQSPLPSPANIRQRADVNSEIVGALRYLAGIEHDEWQTLHAEAAKRAEELCMERVFGGGQ